MEESSAHLLSSLSAVTWLVVPTFLGVTFVSAILIWRRTHSRVHVWVACLLGLFATGGSVLHIHWEARAIESRFDQEMAGLADVAVAVLQMTDQPPEGTTPLLSLLAVPYKQLCRIDMLQHDRDSEFVERTQLITGAAAKNQIESRSGTRTFTAGPVKRANSQVELVADEGLLVAEIQDKASELFQIHFALLSMGFSAVLLVVWKLDRVRLAELDALSAVLESEKERVSNLINSMRGVVWEREGESGDFVLLSRSAQGFLGYPRSRWMEDPGFWKSRLHDDDRRRVENAWHRQTQNPGPYQLQYRVYTAEGNVAHIEEEGTGVRTPEGRCLLRGVFADSTKKVAAVAAAEELRRSQVERARQAGMAELATGVLHNVGNVLNTLNVTARLLADELRDSRVENLRKAAAMLGENAERGSSFFNDDPRGKALPGYLARLSEHLLDENGRMQSQMKEVLDRVDHIRDIVVLQQRHGKVRVRSGSADLANLVQDALRLEGDALASAGVNVETRIHDLPPLDLVPSHILQILVNLISNARHALAGTPAGERSLEIVVHPPEAGKVAIAVKDNGCGIPKSRLTQIFSHGFTTREDGHGFGLHHAALLAQDMGGKLTADSDGPEAGANFILSLPFCVNGQSEPSEARPSIAIQDAVA